MGWTRGQAAGIIEEAGEEEEGGEVTGMQGWIFLGAGALLIPAITLVAGELSGIKDVLIQIRDASIEGNAKLEEIRNSLHAIESDTQKLRR